MRLIYSQLYVDDDACCICTGPRLECTDISAESGTALFGTLSVQYRYIVKVRDVWEHSAYSEFEGPGNGTFQLPNRNTGIFSEKYDYGG